MSFLSKREGLARRSAELTTLTLIDRVEPDKVESMPRNNPCSKLN
jgi:hypothetical protein